MYRIGKEKREHLSSGYLEKAILWTILLLALFLRVYRLDGSSLWSDEGNTWALMERSFAQIAYDAAADIHPPGYYWLLKIWTTLFGTDVNGLRSFSVLCGVALVFVIYKIGTLCESNEANLPTRPPRLALLVALLAALNPFQIYYSQEARMYMLLSLEGAGLFWALLVLMGQGGRVAGWQGGKVARWYVSSILFVLCGIAGLWTHYSFPIILAAAALTYLVYRFSHSWSGKIQSSPHPVTPSPCHPLTLSPPHLVILYLVILLAYLPWLPIAIERILNWPKGNVDIALLDGVRLTLHTLTFGPLRNIMEPHWLWLLGAGILPLLGILALVWHREKWAAGVALALWLLAPIGLMFGLGLFSDAFLKFLLVASPAWCLLLAVVPSCISNLDTDQTVAAQRTLRENLCRLCDFSVFSMSNIIYRVSQLLIGSAALILAVIALPGYYADPSARDNYAGIARYIQALGNPQSDLVILNAPGQQEVWRYYDPQQEGTTFPVVALPKSRPPYPQQTFDTLTTTIQDRSQVFALFWAQDEADPERLVERWLDQNAFKGLDSWQGNVRFVTYSLPNQLECRVLESVPISENQIQLQEQCQPQFPQTVRAGEVILLGLHWQTAQPLDRRYKVTVQLLDSRNQVVAQRDSEPVGGSLPTVDWPANEIITDNHGIAIPPGTPPGIYRMIVAMYDPSDGQRLEFCVDKTKSDALLLGHVEIKRAERSIPIDIVPIMYRLNREIDSITLVGYDAYRKDHRHAPYTPIQPGDQVHMTFYWQGSPPLPDDLHFYLHLGEQELMAPLAGGNFPTSQWQDGEFVRGDFDILYDGTSAEPSVQIEGIELPLKLLPILYP